MSARLNCPANLLNIPGKTRPELVEGRWFRQAQPTPPRFIEKILLVMLAEEGRRDIGR